MPSAWASLFRLQTAATLARASKTDGQFVSACTEKACLPSPATEDDECTECTTDACVGKSFKASDGCNTCTCGKEDDKFVSACTEIGCVPNSTDDKCTECTEACVGKSFPSSDGCNTCSCEKIDGKLDSACTEIACDSASIASISLAIVAAVVTVFLH
eukprot:TRINITY_DN3369_c0_g1_i1.p3 TRINITY_DN3369_c0_g1~~TRINITY_DN3369_c0_g1_i1.p3  ORF type:complete len:158 (-),score=28.30 TRINITY_DN3369_c0_g1_i1:26-499(-)